MWKHVSICICHYGCVLHLSIWIPIVFLFAISFHNWLQLFIQVKWILTAQSTSTEYYEEGSDVCLNFSLDDLHQTTVFMKRDNRTICITTDKSNAYMIPINWENRTFTCSVSEIGFSVCFENFQRTDTGLFSVNVSYTTINSISIKQAGNICFVLWILFI